MSKQKKDPRSKLNSIGPCWRGHGEAKCKGTLIRKNGKYGTFFGCSEYPKCTAKRPARFTISVFRQVGTGNRIKPKKKKRNKRKNPHKYKKQKKTKEEYYHIGKFF